VVLRRVPLPAEVDPWQAPIFEAFWQGRLIPGARIETLPFMEAVRQKRTAQTKVGAAPKGVAAWAGTVWCYRR